MNSYIKYKNCDGEEEERMQLYGALIYKYLSKDYIINVMRHF